MKKIKLFKTEEEKQRLREQANEQETMNEIEEEIEYEEYDSYDYKMQLIKKYNLSYNSLDDEDLIY